jgi:type IV pilus assembly protein PilY1
MLIIDNSGSMYDLAYVDEGDTASGRESDYCYDQTYVSTTTYTGYFDADSVYSYNFTNNRFESSSFSGSCSHQISGQLCVNVVSGTPYTVNEFTVKGNYLNWLTSSKLDVQKKILTGGKYSTTTNEFMPETRGCMGRRFLKEPLLSDYNEGGANTGLGITIAITGPVNAYNPSGVSNGGQTNIQVFDGNYNESLCQDAIDAIVNHNNPSSIRTAVEDCISYDAHAGGSQYCYLSPSTSCTVDSDCDIVGALGECTDVNPKKFRTCLSPASMVGQSCIDDADCDTIASSIGPCVGGTASALNRTKIVFASSMQECWQIWDGKTTEASHDAWSADAPKCADIYAGFKSCYGGTNDGTECSTDAECTGGGTCTNGPDALAPGNAALLCSSTYAGYCATTSDSWATTTWAAKEYTDAEDCFLTKYTEFCGGVNVPSVIDPSDAPSSTAEYSNVPAIISDIGVEAQLGSPIAELTAKRYDATAPTGLLDDFDDMIRFGAMSFNYNGSDYECDLSSTDALECPKVCSTTSSLTCYTNVDCPSGETCVAAAGNEDAAEIIHYTGYGNCSTTTSTSCQEDDECPSGETCNLIGNHSIGLVKAIDDIEATSWTPFAEAYYNAIAYYVKDSTIYTASADAISEPVNAGDIDSNKNPMQYTCQSNNVLIISDGASTADIDPTLTAKALQSTFSDGDATDPATCGIYSGSSYLDDLSYFARNRNIFDPSDSDASDNDLSQRITTYVVYTGSETSTETGECAPKTLMDNTADNGGTVLYNAQNPSQLSSAMINAFQEIASGAASGTAVSVLSTTGEGEGAIYQAYFLPEKMEGTEIRKWLGYIKALFVDKYGNLREDTNSNDALDLTSDLILDMIYDSSSDSGTIVNKYLDADGDGTRDSSTATSTGTLDDIVALWQGGKLLWQRDPADRTIFTTIDGYNGVEFTTANVATLAPYLNNSTNNTENSTFIDWIRGTDTSTTDTSHSDGYRARDITIDSTSNTWKLGDIGHSTPTIVSKPIENYDLLYGDLTYSYYRTAHLKRRLTLYSGGNDGMLHAFNGGCFDSVNHKFHPDVDSSGNCYSGGTRSLGDELWAFIPRGLLPHLKWFSLPEYTHVYYVDLKPKISDVKIFNADTQHTSGWGTILIGGFRLGGNDINWTYGAATYTASPEYFAIDITDPLNPRLLWTFSEADLGLTMTFPAITKIGNSWYAIFGSGPTDFDINSNLTGFQQGTFYVLDLSSGTDGLIDTWTLNDNYWKISTGNTNSFMADPINVDIDLDFDTDTIYFGENYNDGISWNSLMHRITTNKGTQTPNAWQLSTLGDVADISDGKDKSLKITSAPSAAIDDKGNIFVYFGTGQFIGSNDKNHTDTGAFYMLKDACWAGDCTTAASDLLDVSLSTINIDGTVTGISGSCAGAVSTWPDILTASYGCDGWAMYFDLLVENVDFTGAALSHDGERVIGKPLVIGGLAMWTTYIPGIDVCSNEGESNIYAVYYATGSGYTDYIFKEQQEQESPSTTVGRVKRLGAGMPSSISAQVTASGTAKGFVQQSTGTILEIESITPLSITSDVTGWKSDEIE